MGRLCRTGLGAGGWDFCDGDGESGGIPPYGLSERLGGGIDILSVVTLLWGGGGRIRMGTACVCGVFG